MKQKSDPARTLKNVKQLRNVKDRIDNEKKRKAMSIFNVHSLHDMLRVSELRRS